jgi:site-specific DNA-methyltransferase (adenine-specific)
LKENTNIATNQECPAEIVIPFDGLVSLPPNTFINADCMDYLPKCPDGAFDLAIVDPPYGINMAMGHKGSEKRGDKNKYKSFAGNDNEIPNSEYFNELKRVSKNQIIWGANYMVKHLDSTACFIAWDKVQPESFSMAMCEIAWTSFNRPAKIYKKRIVGADDIRIHPTQKPVALYRWLLKQFATQGDLILDTHVGSASSLIACKELGYAYIGFEIDKDYYEAASKRLSRAFRKFELQL